MFVVEQEFLVDFAGANEWSRQNVPLDLDLVNEHFP